MIAKALEQFLLEQEEPLTPAENLAVPSWSHNVMQFSSQSISHTVSASRDG